MGCGESASTSPKPASNAPSTSPAKTAPEDETVRFSASRFYIAHDMFLSTDDPKLVPASEARFMTPNAEVFGVVIGNDARAYPIDMLAYYHVVNDRFGDTPVAVTY